MDAPRRAGDPRPRRAMRVAWWLALCFALLAPPAFADVAVPTLTAHVTDLTGTLTPTQVQFLELRLANLEKRKGSQFLVLMLPTTQSEAIEEFSLKVAEKNRIGRKDVDDGLLLVVAKDDHKARIEVGYGLEGVVTDAISSRIIREYLAPKFRGNDYAGGLDDATATLEKLIDGEPLPPPLAANDHAAHDSPTWMLALFIGAFVGLFAAGTRIKPALLRRIGAGGIAAAVALSMLGFGGALAVAAIVAFVVSGANGGSRYVGSGGPWIGGGGGGFGGGGFGGGGGGFSGGGGGFGGGGASGGW